jgi:Holliday junction resolvase RusA-like endonuclease
MSSDRPPTAKCVLPRPKGAALNARVHWAVRAKQTKADRAHAKWVGELTAPAAPITQPLVELVWRGRGRLPDADNVAGRCKAYLDGLTDAGWWRDDADIVWIRATTERIAKGEEPGVVVRVWEAAEKTSSPPPK